MPKDRIFKESELRKAAKELRIDPKTIDKLTNQITKDRKQNDLEPIKFDLKFHQ